MAPEDIPDDNSSWADLNEFIYRNYLSVGYMGRYRFEHRNLLWEKVSHEPIERRDILNLRRSGWEVFFLDIVMQDIQVYVILMKKKYGYCQIFQHIKQIMQYVMK